VSDRIVREPERREVTGIGRTKWWGLEREGRVPKRRLLAGHRVGWLESELVEWMHAQPVGTPPAPRKALESRGVTPREAV
jgi:predicted DNA-binding transcriptional regulator AlpA